MAGAMFSTRVFTAPWHPSHPAVPASACARQCSSSEVGGGKYEVGGSTTSAGAGSKAPSHTGRAGSTATNKSARGTPPQLPDFGLASTHEVKKLLGRGGEGETWLCVEKATGAEVAIKLIKRPIPKPAIAVIKREIKIQSDLGAGHLNIVNANEVLLSRTHLGLVLEYVPGEVGGTASPSCFGG
jgi:hypothetical protein